MLHAKTLQYNLFRLSLWWHPTCPLTSKDVSTSPALLNLVDPRKPLYCIVGRVVLNGNSMAQNSPTFDKLQSLQGRGGGGSTLGKLFGYFRPNTARSSLWPAA